MDNQQSEMVITWSPTALVNGYSCILLGDRLRDMRTVRTISNVTVALQKSETPFLTAFPTPPTPPILVYKLLGW
jgi:hypothetical protein